MVLTQQDFDQIEELLDEKLDEKLETKLEEKLTPLNNKIDQILSIVTTTNQEHEITKSKVKNHETRISRLESAITN